MFIVPTAPNSESTAMVLAWKKPASYWKMRAPALSSGS